MWSKWHIAHFDPLWSLAVTLPIPQLHEWRLLGGRLASAYIMCSNKCPTDLTICVHFQASHLALLDGLMSVYASSTVTVERVVKAVR